MKYTVEKNSIPVYLRVTKETRDNIENYINHNNVTLKYCLLSGLENMGIKVAEVDKLIYHK